MPIGSDVANVPAVNPPTTPTYCTVADVYRRLQQPIPTDAEGEGDLTNSDVVQLIIDNEDHIDAETNRSWRARRVELEYHDYTTLKDELDWILVQLNHSPAQTLSAGSGDALEVRAGNQWEDWLATKTEGIAGDYWLEEPAGYLRLRRHWFWSDHAAVRVSYRYGYSAVPQDIRMVCSKLTAAEIQSGLIESQGGSGGGSNRTPVERKVENWRSQAYAALAKYQSVGRGY